MVVVAPGLLALVLGWFAFRSRVTGVYISIVTQAMTFALMLAFFRNDMGFGGNNGLTALKDILGFPVQAQGPRIGLYVASVAMLGGGFLLCRHLTRRSEAHTSELPPLMPYSYAVLCLKKQQ